MESLRPMVVDRRHGIFVRAVREIKLSDRRAGRWRIWLECSAKADEFARRSGQGLEFLGDFSDKLRVRGVSQDRHQTRLAALELFNRGHAVRVPESGGYLDS